MMNTSSDSAPEYYPIPVSSLTYREVGESPNTSETEHSKEQEDIAEAVRSKVAKDTEVRINNARVEAIAETEALIRSDCRAHSEAEATKIAEAIALFQQERQDYFARVESDVVHLALAIAAKILHREAQVDTMLVAGLVRVAINKLHDGSSVSVRVCSSSLEKWEKYLATSIGNSTVEVIADDQLGAADCILETNLGSANFSMDAQLREVEQGFFDLLAQRPQIR